MGIVEGTSLIREPLTAARPAARPVAAPWPTARVMLLGALLALTLSAAAIRLSGLQSPDGQLDGDEAKVALAADGVLRTGLPILPSGRMYTRGLLNSYLVATSFAAFGRHDFAARLPSALAGALLVPLVFLLGRALGGVPVGLAAAAFTALAEPLVAWSRSGWLPGLFVPLFIASAYAGYRGFVERRSAWQVAAAGSFCLTLLTYEFGVLLPAALAVYLGLLAVSGRHDWYLGKPTLLAFTLFAAGLVLFTVLALTLRAGTLAGPASEARNYFEPGLTLKGVGYYLTQVMTDYLVLFGIALLGLLPLARARPRGTLYLGSLLALALLVPSFVIQNKLQTRYVLPALPLLAILAAASVLQLANALSSRLQPGSSARTGLGAERRLHWRTLAPLLVVALAIIPDIGSLDSGPAPASGPTWLEVARQEIEADDLVITEVPTIAAFYLGRADFYLANNAFERYAYRTPEGTRFIYASSILLREQADFGRLVERPNPGRVVWLLGHDDRLLGLANLVTRMDRRLWASLVASADRVINTADGWVLVRVTLPRRGQSA